MMIEEYPLFPELTEEGKAEAQRIMDSFKPKLAAMMDEVMGDLYCDVSYYVESDHWTNYRNAIMRGLTDYQSDHPHHQRDYGQVRRAIYENHKEEIIKDLNQDLVEENERLKAENKRLYDEISNLRMYR
ncbi:MAG: hypothetical protein KDC99_18805 [Cyclobacteriaceae bacterium]|nr:hypothetical protein [Cyclobacteriaceae bacterium]